MQEESHQRAKELRWAWARTTVGCPADDRLLADLFLVNAHYGAGATGVAALQAGKPLVRLVPGTPGRRLGGRGSLVLDPLSLDAAFSPEAEGEVTALFSGESP